MTIKFSSSLHINYLSPCDSLYCLSVARILHFQELPGFSLALRLLPNVLTLWICEEAHILEWRVLSVEG